MARQKKEYCGVLRFVFPNDAEEVVAIKVLASVFGDLPPEDFSVDSNLGLGGVVLTAIRLIGLRHKLCKQKFTHLLERLHCFGGTSGRGGQPLHGGTLSAVLELASGMPFREVMKQEVRYALSRPYEHETQYEIKREKAKRLCLVRKQVERAFQYAQAARLLPLRASVKVSHECK